MVYAVIDTNVIVSAAIAKNPEISIPSKVVEFALDGLFVPLFNETIVREYEEVLSRPKFNLDEEKRKTLIQEFLKCGINVDAPESGVELPDPKDIVFYDVALACRDKDASLVTGNTKHFPGVPFAVTPREFLEILVKEGV